MPTSSLLLQRSSWLISAQQIAHWRRSGKMRSNSNGVVQSQAGHGRLIHTLAGWRALTSGPSKITT